MMLSSWAMKRLQVNYQLREVLPTLSCKYSPPSVLLQIILNTKVIKWDHNRTVPLFYILCRFEMLLAAVKVCANWWALNLTINKYIQGCVQA